MASEQGGEEDGEEGGVWRGPGIVLLVLAVMNVVVIRFRGPRSNSLAEMSRDRPTDPSPVLIRLL